MNKEVTFKKYRSFRNNQQNKFNAKYTKSKNWMISNNLEKENEENHEDGMKNSLISNNSILYTELQNHCVAKMWVIELAYKLF